MKKKKVLISVIIVELVIVIMAVGLIIWLNHSKNAQQGESAFGNVHDYTWEEFEALSDQDKLAFSKQFEGDDFEKWMEAVKPQETDPEATMPWDNGGKRPDEYSWEEYEALPPEQQMGFFNWFDSVESFDAWLTRVNSQETTPTDTEKLPWELGGKQPDTYTWQEYEALSDEQQMAFYDWFGSSENFEAWRSRVSSQETVPAGKMPWDNGGKQPDEYTWAEYEALTAEQQVAFFYWFASTESFDAWMNSVKPQETNPAGKMPWDNGGKQPDEYTWAEYEALTADQQMAFFYWFDSVEAFDAWMTAAKGQ